MWALTLYAEALQRWCREILVMVMRKHQRYFPVYDAAGELLPVFVTVANGAVDLPTVKACPPSLPPCRGVPYTSTSTCVHPHHHPPPPIPTPVCCWCR